jgi:hypothetical protein
LRGDIQLSWQFILVIHLLKWYVKFHDGLLTGCVSEI